MLASNVTCSSIWASLRKAAVVVVDLGVVGIAGNRRRGDTRSVVGTDVEMGGGMEEVDGRRAAAAELGLPRAQSTIAEVFVVEEAGAFMAILGC